MLKKLLERFGREKTVAAWMERGCCSRAAANRFYKEIQRDLRAKNGITVEEKQWAHEKGYLSKRIEQYDLRNKPDFFISDLDFASLRPINNSFSKWFDDLLTVRRVLHPYREFLPKMHFSIIDREGRKVFLPVESSNPELGGGDEAFFALLKEKGRLILAPSRRWSRRSSYLIEAAGDDSYRFLKDDLGVLRCSICGRAYDKNRILNRSYGQTLYGADDLLDLISSLEYNWVVYEPYDTVETFEGFVKVFVGVRDFAYAEILDIYRVTEKRGSPVYQRVSDFDALGLENSSFIEASIKELAAFVGEISFFTVYVVPTETGFVVDTFDSDPALPSLAFSEKLNSYLLSRVSAKRLVPDEQRPDYRASVKKRAFERFVERFCRPGMRPYMQKLWMHAVWDDFKHGKTNSLPQKLWAWRRGFLSYRIQQYGLTEENYRDFLSDYQYHWLNRINNDYQVWINDKLTTRYVLEPYKQYLAEYYFAFFKQDGLSYVKALPDLPGDVEASYDGLFGLLKKKHLIALKPSAGTHGDGFYRLEWFDGSYFVNGCEKSERDIVSLIEGFRSFYVATEYLFLHPDLRDIYPNALNTVRVAVVNQDAIHPKIMQAYMRIGSSGSGYTDNIGYGGICAYVDVDSGFCHSPETLKDHVYVASPLHPDTGVVIERHIPNWDVVRKGVIDLCCFMPQLEYLGFDIAVTEEGFKILEINIHQDLHKVAEHSEEFRAFYRDKLALKAGKYGLNRY